MSASVTAPEIGVPARKASTGWVIFTVGLGLFVTFVVATMRTGVGGDPRIANPDPGPAPYDILLPDPLPFFIMSFGGTVALFGVLLWISWRQRRLHQLAIIGLGAIFTGLVDPLANWATFASLNPKVPHLPTEWPWIRLAPLSEPAAAFLGGYATYYLAIGAMSYWMTKRFVFERADPGSFRHRHPLVSLFACVWITSFPFNAVFQLAWMGVGMLVYTQFAGPALHVGHLQLPYLILLYDPFVYATLAIMLVRNDNGDSLVLSNLARRLPGRSGRPRNSSGRQVIVAGALMIASILFPISGFCAIRGLGLADNVVYDEWPFPQTNVYDPYGTVEAEGKPGPFRE